ncbi:DMT family transporter [Microtetraspora niveoalba]|uniref:DMT family transporter n=1 Tax=Microtetraspora niveoalba TaxID=46175 RepID=UPI0008350054|nr:EamA family transporter [Microtetraspora niveoalba]
MTHVPSLPVRRGLIFVSAAGVAWGTGGAVGDFLRRAGDLGPVAVTFWRFVIGAALLLAVTYLGRTTGSRRVVRPRSWRKVLALGIATAVSQVAYFAAIAESGVALATMVAMGANPLFVAAGARLVLGEHAGRAANAGIGAAVAGLALLTGGPLLTGGSALTHGEFSPVGTGYAVLSGAAYAAVTLLSGAGRSSGEGAPQGAPGETMGWSFVAGAVCLLPFAAVDGVLPSGADPGAAALGLLYLGAVPTALAYGLFFAGLGVVSGTTAAVVVLLEPLVAALIGVVSLGERLTALQLTGAALLMAAVYRLGRAELADRRTGEGDAAGEYEHP